MTFHRGRLNDQSEGTRQRVPRATPLAELFPSKTKPRPAEQWRRTARVLRAVLRGSECKSLRGRRVRGGARPRRGWCGVTQRLGKALLTTGK